MAVSTAVRARSRVAGTSRASHRKVAALMQAVRSSIGRSALSGGAAVTSTSGFQLIADEDERVDGPGCIAGLNDQPPGAPKTQAGT